MTAVGVTDDWKIERDSALAGYVAASEKLKVYIFIPDSLFNKLEDIIKRRGNVESAVHQQGG